MGLFDKYFSKTPIDTSVKIAQDESVISNEEIKGMTPEERKLYMAEMRRHESDLKLGKLAQRGLKSHLEKSDRVFHLINSIQSGKTKTLDEAVILVGVGLPTVKRYLKENNISFDSKTGNILYKLA